MEYGKLQGEIVAAGRVAGLSAVASLIGTNFNVAGVSVVSPGLFAVTLGDGVDQFACAITASGNSSPSVVGVNESGLDTDTVKRFIVTNGGVLQTSGFHFIVVRTTIP